jgi:hypothetical protein
VGIALVLFLPAWVLQRRRLAAGEKITLLFAGAWLLYWSAVLDTLRFAGAPLALLTALTAARLLDWDPVAPKALRAAHFAAAAYSLLFALSGAMILEINLPQLRLFAGKVDKAGYLREALATYPSLEYLRSHAAPQERVLGFQNCSAAYAPAPAQFRCSFNESDIRTWLATGSHTWLIVPRGAEQGFAQTALARPVHSDSHYAVYRLGPSRGTSGP